jgi:hypothetical protein
MNPLALLNRLKRGPLTVKIRCTATTATGQTDTVEVTIQKNKINKLQGNGLSSVHLYDLAKKGKTRTADLFGNVFEYEIVEEVKEVAELQTAEEAK